MFILFSVFQCSLLQRRNVSISKRTCVPPPPSKTASHSLCNQVLVTSMQRAESGTLRPTSPPSGLAERKWEFKPPPPRPQTPSYSSLPSPARAFPTGRTQTGRSMWKRVQRGSGKDGEDLPTPTSLSLYFILLALEPLPSY